MRVLVLFFVALVVFGGAKSCGGSDVATDYHSHDTTVTNDDGSTTTRMTDNMGGDFSCTWSADSSDYDCSGTP